MKKILVLLVMCLGLLQVDAQEVKMAVTPKTSVSFPGQPSKTEAGAAVNYILAAKDSAYVYTVAVIDLEASRGLSAEVIALAVLDPTFWDQVETGYLTSMGEGFVKRKREVRTINGKQALYIEGDKKDGSSAVDIAALVFMEGKYSINFVHINKTGKDPGRERFFSSIETKE